MQVSPPARFAKLNANQVCSTNVVSVCSYVPCSRLWLVFNMQIMRTINTGGHWINSKQQQDSGKPDKPDKAHFLMQPQLPDPLPHFVPEPIPQHLPDPRPYYVPAFQQRHQVPDPMQTELCLGLENINTLVGTTQKAIVTVLTATCECAAVHMYTLHPKPYVTYQHWQMQPRS